jgi:O-antigen ligase
LTAAASSLRRLSPVDFAFAGLIAVVGLAAAVSVKIALLLVFAGCVAIFMVVRPSAFVPLLIASVFFGAVSVGDLTLARIVGPIAFVVAVVHALRTGSLGLSGTTIHRWIAGYGLLAVASLYWSWSSEFTVTLLFSLLIAVTYLLAITGLTRTRADLQLAMWTFPFAAIALAALGIFSFARYGSALAAQPLIGDRNFFAAFLVAAIPPSLAMFALTRNRWLRAATVLATAMSVAGVVASGSQGGALALLGSALLAAVIVPPPRVRRRLLPFLLVLIPLVLAAVALVLTRGGPDTAGQRGAQAAVKRSSVDRVNLWLGAWHAYRMEPLTGVGYGAYAPNSSQMMLETPGVDLRNYNLPNFPQEAHNTYLEALTELGPLGVLLFLGMIGNTALVLARLLRVARARGDLQFTATSLALLISLFGFAIASFFLSVQTNRGWWVLIALTIAAARIAAREWSMPGLGRGDATVVAVKR